MKNKLFQLIKRKLFNKKVITFIVCLLIASFLWLINALNRNYTRTVAIPVKYVNLPKDRVIAGELPRFIMADIKTSGAKLLFILLKKNLKEIVVDVDALTSKKRTNIVAANTQIMLGSMSKRLNSEVELLKVKPDSIYFNFGKSYQKIVPVRPDLHINFNPSYNFTDKIKITPAFVTITGDSLLITKIDSISTEKIVLNKLNKSISQVADLILPEEYSSRVAVSINKVTLNLSIDKYTESTLEVPINIINLPPSYQVKTFPDKVQVKYQVAMGIYEKVSAADFKMTIDYTKINPSKTKIKVEQGLCSDQIKIIKINPEKVEYIIRKQ